MAKSLAGRVAAITGASSGIGASTAEACGERGMRVGLFARREERLLEVAERVRSAGGEAEVVPGDVRDREAVFGLVERVTRRWHHLDVVVANAGFGITAPIAGTPPDEAREIFDVNVLGSVWAVQAAWPIFRTAGAGHAILVSSAAAIHGLPANGLYSATKAAQRNMAEALRIEAGEIGVDVSVVYPIMTTGTEFRKRVADHTGEDEERESARVGGPRQSAGEVAAAIVDCMESPRFEVYPWKPARLLPLAEAASPRLTARLLRYREYYRRQTESS